MKSIAVIAPHPDDETLGCGGTLLRFGAEGAALHWIIVTRMGRRWSAARRKARRAQVREVSRLYAFRSVTELGFEAATLTEADLPALVDGLSAALKKAAPETVLVPHGGDAHSDHRVVFAAASACAKWFRRPELKRVWAYEVISETGFALAEPRPFDPAVFVDVSAQLPRKLEALSVFREELGAFPFPRSLEAVEALARLRGASAGFRAAEAFMPLRERL
jgi:LmbE family N-acetylglucosaminyl deacetylase